MLYRLDMSAAASLSLVRPRLATALVPRELEEVLSESRRAQFAFNLLSDRDRGGFVRYVDEATIPAIRERRAAFVAMSLVTLSTEAR